MSLGQGQGGSIWSEWAGSHDEPEFPAHDAMQMVSSTRPTHIGGAESVEARSGALARYRPPAMDTAAHPQPLPAASQPLMLESSPPPLLNATFRKASGVMTGLPLATRSPTKSTASIPAQSDPHTPDKSGEAVTGSRSQKIVPGVRTASTPAESAPPTPDASSEPSKGSPWVKLNSTIRMAAHFSTVTQRQKSNATHKGEESETQDDEPAAGPGELLFPLLHVLWYLIILMVSLQMMWTWMQMHQGADNVRGRLEWLLTDKPLTLVADRQDFLRWVASTLLAKLAPTGLASKGVCGAAAKSGNVTHDNGITATREPESRLPAPDTGVAVFLQDGFAVRDETMWAFGDTITHICPGALMVAPRGALLQEISSRRGFRLPASGARGLVVEGRVGDEGFNDMYALSVCTGTAGAAACINMTLGKMPRPAAIHKRLMFCPSDGEHCVGTEHGKSVLKTAAGQRRWRGSMVNSMFAKPVKHPCLSTWKNPSSFSLVITESRALLRDNTCDDVTVDDVSMRDLLQGEVVVRLLVNGVVAGNEWTEWKAIRARQATSAEIEAVHAAPASPFDPATAEDSSWSGFDWGPKTPSPSAFPRGGMDLGAWYLSEHDVILRQVRGLAHLQPSDLVHSAIFNSKHEHREPFGKHRNFTWSSSNTSAGYWGKVREHAASLWYPNNGFVSVIERSILLEPGAAAAHIEKLIEDGWLDRRSHAIFIEFAVNSFDSRQSFPHFVRLVGEFPPTSEVKFSVETKYKSLDNVLDDAYGMEALQWTLGWLLFYFVVLVFHASMMLVSELMEMRIIKLAYFNNGWNLIDVFSICILAWSCQRFGEVWGKLNTYLESVAGDAQAHACQMPGARTCELFLSYELSQSMQNFIFTFSIFVAVHVFKVLKYATLVPALDLPFQAIVKVLWRVLTLIFTMLVVGMSCSILFTGAVGSEIHQFSEFWTCSLHIMGIATGFEDEAMLTLVERYPLTGAAMRTACSFFLVIIVMNIFIAVLVEGYTIAVEEEEEEGEDGHKLYHVVANELQKLRVKYFGETVSKVSPDGGHGQGDDRDPTMSGPLGLFLPDNPHDRYHDHHHPSHNDADHSRHHQARHHAGHAWGRHHHHHHHAGSAMTLPRAGSAEGNVEGTHAGLHTLYELDLDERQTLRDVKDKVGDIEGRVQNMERNFVQQMKLLRLMNSRIDTVLNRLEFLNEDEGRPEDGAG